MSRIFNHPYHERIIQLKKLLYETKFGFPAAQLFKNQKGLLAELLANKNSTLHVSEEDPKFVKKLNSLRVNAHKFFFFDRPPSEQFLESLEAIISEKIKDDNQKQEVLKTLREIFLIQEAAEKISSSKVYPEELIDRIKTAHNQTVFSDMPLELYDNTYSEQLIGTIIANFINFNEGMKLIKKHPLTSYEFHFSSALIARQFYCKIIDEISKALPERADEVTRYFEDSTQSYLRMYIVHKFFCTFPVTVLDLNHTNVTGYVHFIHDRSVISIAQMAATDIALWYDDFYLRAKFTRKYIAFEPHREKEILPSSSI